MAIIDVVKYEQREGELVHKFPSCDLRWGTQLVVYPGQRAFFLKGGKVYDEFEEGTYTLKSNNIPLLNKVVNIPFGSDSPFQADVWFVNLLTRLDFRWGTETPIQLEDPKYKIIVPVRAFGQYGFRISDASKFLLSLVGNMPTFNDAMLQSYFRGILLTKLTDIISSKIITDGISVLDINSNLESISQYCRDSLIPVFLQYGVQIEQLNIISINIPEDDPSLAVIKNAKSLAARLSIVGQDVYKMERTLDVMDAAARNEANGGGLIHAGIGLGAGLGLGNQFSNTMTTALPNLTDTPPAITPKTYFLAIDGQPQGSFSSLDIENAYHQKRITPQTLIWRKGLTEWSALSELPEFKALCLTNDMPDLK